MLLDDRERHRDHAGDHAAPSTAAAAAPPAARAAARGARRARATSPAPTPAARPACTTHSTRTATTIGQRPVAGLCPPGGAATKRTDERDRGERERHDHELVAVPERVEELAERAPRGVFARRASWWYVYDWSHTSAMPNGSAATTYTATAIPAATAASRTPVRSSAVREQHDQTGDHHRRHRQRLDRHRAAGREPHPHRGAQARVVAVAQRERDREHRQRERRAVGVHRHRHPEDRAARGDQPGGEQRVAARRR